MGFEVLLFVPNIIGYIRLALIVGAFSVYSSNAVWFLLLYTANVILDGIDGWAARKLNQTSAFGAWFDVVIDNFGRGFLWSRLYKDVSWYWQNGSWFYQNQQDQEPEVGFFVSWSLTAYCLYAPNATCGEWGYVVATLEWTVFVCTHSIGAEWKSSFIKAPYIARKVMEKNFKTPLGTFTILGLHVLPVWLYAHYTRVLSTTLRLHRSFQYAGIAFFSAGRAVCLSVELYCLWAHIRYLLRDTEKEQAAAKQKKEGT